MQLEHGLGVDRLVHGCCIATECSWLDERTDLNNIVGTIMINQQNLTCSQNMLSGDDEITRLNSDMLQYNNNELGCCIKSGFACSMIREQTVLLQGC